MSAESPSAGSPKLAGGYKIYIFTGGTGTITI
jgi:altronate dehydratase